MRKKILLPFLALIFLNSFINGQSDLYKVYALKFKYAGINSATGAVVGASPSDSIDVCYMIWFLKGSNGHNILVDTGDTDSTGAGITDFVRMDKLLGDINIATSDITDIIITHPHFDHINGLKLFPYGKVWMQRKDFEYFVADAWRDSNFREGFNQQDVRNLIDVALDGRLNLVDGDNIEIIPGVKVFTESSHTKENQYLLVTSENQNKIILASDAIWFYLNFRRLTPIEIFVMDPEAYVNAMKRMKTLVKDEKYIIPGHDNLVFSKFQKVTDRVVMIE